MGGHLYDFVIFIYDMKILLSESQFNLIRNLDKKVNQIYFNNLVENVLLEANKKDILVNKLGIKEQIANQIYQLTGNLAVWMTKKIIAFYMSYHNKSKDDAIKHINSNIFYRGKIVGIMDWIRVGLNGNIKPYDNLNFDELYDKSKEWHDSLQIGDSKIDYVEEREIVVDLREDGEGFYWVDLDTSKCTEEGERMGHCARSDGNLYSLREYKKIPNDHTLNKSHLTASVSDDGKILQLKGPKNSKPKSEYHKYIIEFLLAKYPDNDVEYIVDGFGYEYESKNDFKLTDLSEEQVKYVYSKRPELFVKRRDKKMLEKLGLIEKDDIDYKFTLEIKPIHISSYISGGYIVKKGTRSDGSKFEYDVFEAILNRDLDILERKINERTFIMGGRSLDFNEAWKRILEHYVNNENKNKIIEILRNFAGENFDEELSMVEMITEYDVDKTIMKAIVHTADDILTLTFYNILLKALKTALVEYGEIISIDSNGVKLKIDLEKYLDDEHIEDAFDIQSNRVGNNMEIIFEELRFMGYIEKPKFIVGKNWDLEFDEKKYNSILKDKLANI
jgi:hypothetical protein